MAMKNMKFSPATIDIKKGDTVEWKNDDITPHTRRLRLHSIPGRSLPMPLGGIPSRRPAAFPTRARSIPNEGRGDREVNQRETKKKNPG